MRLSGITDARDDRKPRRLPRRVPLDGRHSLVRYMSKILFHFPITIRNARTFFNTSNRLTCYLFSSNTNNRSCQWYDNMTSDSKTRLLDDPLDDLRESKRMKNLPDPSEHIRSALDDPRRAPTDASEGVFGGTGGSPSVASTHDVMEKHAKSIKRSTSAGYAKSGKGKQKSERRNRRGTRDSEPAVKEEGPKAIRLPKRQCALLIGFCGSGYSGMQMYAFCNYSLPFLSSSSSQPDHARTIEGVLFQSMVRAGAVSQDNADDPVKVIVHDFLGPEILTIHRSALHALLGRMLVSTQRVTLSPSK